LFTARLGRGRLIAFHLTGLAPSERSRAQF
jgi:hypothetical protein